MQCAEHIIRKLPETGERRHAEDNSMGATQLLREKAHTKVPKDGSVAPVDGGCGSADVQSLK